jgi:hypothetical protein
MGALGSKLRRLEGGRVGFFCPACREVHQISVADDGGHYPGRAWGFNGNGDAPTFSPSILVRGKQVERDAAGRWTGEWVRGPDGKALDRVCHSFVRDGRIEFLGDCTHALAGQTVDLPSFTDPDE